MSILNRLPARNRRLVSAAVVLLLLAGGAVLAWGLSEHREDKFRPYAVQRGLLYRSRQLGKDDFSGLKRRNITQVVNLRSESEDPQAYATEAGACQAQGMRMVHIPIVEALPDDGQIVRFLRAVNDNQGATLVHCAQGRSRTGFMVAAFRVVMDAWPARQAYDEMVQDGYEPSDANGKNERFEILERLGRQRAEWLGQINTKTTQP